MKYYVPDIWISEDLDIQSSIEDKFGGLPWGLGVRSWPTCAECGKSQSFLAQIQHHRLRFDLGKPGRMMFIFQCNNDPGMCSTWEGGSGANACFVVEAESLTNCVAELPADRPLIERELRVVDWVEREDEISELDIASFYDDDMLFSLSEAILQRVTASTKLGSVPAWIQSASEGPSDGWRFVGQLDSTHSFITAPISAVQWVAEDSEFWEGRSHHCEGASFGDGGIAYLFVKDTGTVPKCWFFWQC